MIQVAGCHLFPFSAIDDTSVHATINEKAPRKIVFWFVCPNIWTISASIASLHKDKCLLFNIEQMFNIINKNENTCLFWDALIKYGLH